MRAMTLPSQRVTSFELAPTACPTYPTGQRQPGGSLPPDTYLEGRLRGHHLGWRGDLGRGSAVLLPGADEEPAEETGPR
jgi:hypothetical protein